MRERHGAAKAIFLDRDGVLNATHVRDGKPYAPGCIEDFRVFPGVEQVVKDLKQSGFLLIVVTNQPDVGNGLVEREVVEAMNAVLAEVLPLDGIKVCYHAQNDGCACRKPKPGMILEAALEFDIDLTNSFMVGDRRGDVLAGAAAGCRTIFLNNGYRQSEHPIDGEADCVVSSLTDAVDYILSQTSTLQRNKH